MCLSQCVCSLTKSFSVKLFMTLGDTAKKETVYWDPRRECVTVSNSPNHRDVCDDNECEWRAYTEARLITKFQLQTDAISSSLINDLEKKLKP